MTPNPQRSAADDLHRITSLGDAARLFFSRPGPKLIAAKAAIAWGLRAMAGPPRPVELAVCAGVAAWWPVQEWLAHKHLLHLVPRTIRGRRIDPLFASRHRAHHRDPRNLKLTLLPVPVLLAAMPANVALWTNATRDPRVRLTGIAAYSTMALIYEWTHFLVHTGYAPRSAFYARVRRNHRNHHYLNENYWLSFVWPDVDKWLGTEPAPGEVARSPTARKLHGLDD
jgi:hypothetical protein